MKKAFKCLVLAMVVLTGMLGFVACGKKDMSTHVSSLDELKTAIENGGDITLDKDIEGVNSMITISKDTDLNLNGKKVTGDLSSQTDKVMFHVVGAKLDVSGNGTINGNDCYIFGVSNKDSKMGKLEIDDGTYKATESSTVVHAYEGEVEIKGGSYENTSTQYGSKYLINKQDNKKTTTKIEISGGSFKNFNPQNNNADGANTNYLKSGYKVTENAGTFTVSK